MVLKIFHHTFLMLIFIFANVVVKKLPHRPNVGALIYHARVMAEHFSLLLKLKCLITGIYVMSVLRKVEFLYCH